MDFLKRSIRNKLLLITSVSTVLVLAVAFNGLYGGLRSLDKFDRFVVDEQRVRIDALRLHGEFKKQVQEWNNVLLRGHLAGDMEQYWGRFQRSEARVRARAQALLEQFERRASGQAGATAAVPSRLLAEFLASHTALGESYREARRAFIASGYDSRGADRLVRGADREPTRLLIELESRLGEIEQGSREDIVSSSERGLVSTMALLGATIATAFVAFLWLINRGLIAPVRAVETSLERMARGDFSAAPPALASSDEIGRLAASAAQLQHQLGALIGDMRAAIERLGSASGELSSVAERVNSGAHSQRCGVLDFAGSMEQVVASVERVAENAARAQQAAQSTSREAASGRGIVSETRQVVSLLADDVARATDVVQQMEQGGNEIGAVLDVIRDIAEQTNLLALNAAIEAARAGDQGRGFAVVADEVRTLASRTQESTAQIQDTIGRLQSGTREAVEVMEASSERARNAVGDVAAADRALDSITEAAQTITGFNDGIAEVVEEQNALMGGMRGNIGEISRTAEEGQRGAELAQRATAELASLADELQRITARFSVPARGG